LGDEHAEFIAFLGNRIDALKIDGEGLSEFGEELVTKIAENRIGPWAPGDKQNPEVVDSFLNDPELKEIKVTAKNGGTPDSRDQTPAWQADDILVAAQRRSD
jgi:hypothetical protein